MNMKAIVADAVESTFTLSADASENIAVAAEMVADSALDFRKGCDLVGSVFSGIKAAGELTFAAWEVVRKHFESAAAVRARDNGAIDPAGAANDYWGRVAGFLKEYHGLTKPKSEKPESVAKAAKREAEKSKALAVAGGKSAAELKSEIRAFYGEATDDSIAKAKVLEKALKVVESAEKEAVSAQMKPLADAANAQHKAIMEFMKAQNNPTLLGDYVVLLKETLGIWQSQVSVK